MKNIKVHLKKLKNKYLIILVLGLVIILPLLLNYLTRNYYSSRIYYDIKLVPNYYAALVLGAGIDNNNPSPILKTRIITAVNLYKAGKVKKLIMSGDNRFTNYSEPDVMINTASKLGVLLKDIQADYAGRRTYDSCYRAKNIFNQNNIIVITQDFHITRTLFLCNNLGISTVGFIADLPQTNFLNIIYWYFRDIYSLIDAYKDIYFYSPQVVKGQEIKI